MVTTAGVANPAERSGAGSVCDGVFLGLGGEFEGDFESVGLEPGDEAAAFLVGVDSVGEVVGAQILVGPAGGEHVPEDHDQLVRDRDDRLLFAAGLRNPPNLRTWRR